MSNGENEKVPTGKILGYSLLALVAILALSFLIGNYDLVMKKYFGTRNANIDREIFEQNKSFRSGAAQELLQMQRDYVMGNPEQKIAMRAIIKHKAAEVPEDALTPDLRTFINSLDGYQGQFQTKKGGDFK
jgi:hypothetical protein